MKKFSKLLLTLALASMMGLSLVGCNNPNNSSSDTGSTNTGSSDTGSSDTGSSDTGSSDTGSSDTGSSDTGSSDTGSDTPGGPDDTPTGYLLGAKIGVGGYEWGPAVDTVLFNVDGTVSADDLSADMFTATTSVSQTSFEGGQSVTNNVDVDLEVLDAYPCTADGIETTEDSEWFAVKFAAAYNTLSPFTYANSVNNWSTGNVTVTIELTEGSALSIQGETGVESYDDFSYSDPISIADRVVPATAAWTKDTHTEGDITLGYGAYETDEMKNDGEDNPLIIWLHGAGEGGTDVDIALLGNEVTSLATEDIQKYFTNDDVQGAYVLAVQTPTMWMNDGTGEYTTTGTSVYTNALMETIEAYVEANGDVDMDRIYVGGCSNGGYMTMNMLLQHGDYFAAAYPVCEAYSDAWITDDQIADLAEMNIWFTHSADDTTVNPANYTNATYIRLLEAGATNVYFSYFESVIGTDDEGEAYMGHWSWIYTLQDQCTRVQSVDLTSADGLTASNNGGGSYIVSVNGEETTLWGWLAAQTKGESEGDVALDPDASVDPDDSTSSDTTSSDTTSSDTGSDTPGTDTPSGDAVRFEAETDATIAGTVSGNESFIDTAAAASGGQCLGSLSASGNTVTFTFTAAEAGTAEIVFGMSSSSVNYETFLVADMTLNSTVATVSLNGVNIDYTPQVIAGQSSTNMSGYNEVFTDITMGTQNIVAGENTVVITIQVDGSGAPNIDYMDVISNVAIS